MASEDVMRKIRALLAKEGAHGTTPEEVAASLALAQRLLEREGLTRESLQASGEADEPEETMVKSSEPLFGSREMQASTWRGYLAGVLAQANGCVQYRSGGAYFLVGRPSDIQVIRYLFAYCEREIDRLTRGACVGQGRTYANNFRIGCVDAIHKAIQAERDAERAQQRAAATGGALVLLDRAIALRDARVRDADALMRMGTRVRTGRATFRSDNGARSAGQAAGASIYPGSGKGARIGAGSLRLGSGR